MKHVFLRLAGGSAICAMLASPSTARAEPQSSAVVLGPSSSSPPPGAEHSAGPNMTLLGAGVATFVFSYGPAASIAIYSDHKGDKNLFIPVVGPWLDLGNRNCEGPTIATINGPVELSSQKTCGTSSIERAALITGGVLQGLAALQVMGSFFVQEKRPTAFEAPPMPKFAIYPTFDAHSMGAMARGRF